MKISAVLLARFFAFIETYDLNPRGKAFFPEIVNSLVARYGFAKFPQKLEDFDEKKGVAFEGGRSGDVGIVQIKVHDHAIYVDTTSSTEDSEKLFYEILSGLSETHGLNFSPDMVKRKTYVSQLTFYSDILFPKLHPAISKLAQHLSTRVPQYYGQPLEYRASGLVVGYDPQTVKSGPAAFSIEPRADTLFSEGKYFATAPLPTDEHIALLEAFEADVLAASK